MKKTIILLSLVIASAFILAGCQKQGCTDPLATNYNPDAKGDNGTCKYGPGGTGEVIDITKNIDAPTTFKTGQTIKVCGNIKINAALTIEPNVLIEMCPNATLDVTANGSFNAVGTSNMPIVIKGKVSAPGSWNYIHINSNNPSNIMKYVKISDGGGNSSYGNATIWVNDNNNGQLGMDNVTITNSQKIGVILEKGARFSNFANNTFTNNGTFGIQIPFSEIGDLDGNSNYSGNGEDYIEVISATISVNQTVAATNVPFLVHNSTTDAGLTLSPGVEFKMASGAGIEVKANGYFNAIGTSSKPIKISGKTATYGYWTHIHINSNNPKNEFKYVEVSDGGANASYGYANIFVNDNNTGQFTMNNCKISNSYGWGLIIEKASVSIITPNSVAGMKSANTFSNNGNGSNSTCTGDCSVAFN